MIGVAIAIAATLGVLVGIVSARCLPQDWKVSPFGTSVKPGAGSQPRIGISGPSRATCIELLRTTMEKPGRSARPLAVFVVDCDRFKLINAGYGHGTGDLVLREVARRLRHAAPARHRMASAGGDEFVLVVEDMDDPREVIAAAGTMVDAFDEPLDVLGQPIYTSVSIGAAIAPGHGVSPDVLLAAAEGGMAEAKRSGRRAARMHDREIGQREARRARSLQQVRSAYDGGKLLLHYQPKVRLADGTCTGFEALLRLSTSDGPEAPDSLIEAAEQSGFVSRLGEWVFKEAAAQGRVWRAEGVGVPIAVNLSARQLQDPRFMAFVDVQLSLDPELPKHLQLEITESALARDQLEFTGVLARLRRLGFHIQVDDFGTGYSTMGFLSKMAIDTLKIDRSFIAGLPDARDSRQIVCAMVGMAHALGVCVVAEGIETPAQANWLQQRGCDQGQGFLFARALQPEEAVSFARHDALRGRDWLRGWTGGANEERSRPSAARACLDSEFGGD